MHERHIALGSVPSVSPSRQFSLTWHYRDEALFDVQMDMITFLPADLKLPSGSGKALSSGRAFSLPIWEALVEGALTLRRRDDSRYYFNIPRGLRRSAHCALAEAGSQLADQSESDKIFRVKAALDIMHLGQMLNRDFIEVCCHIFI